MKIIDPYKAIRDTKKYESTGHDFLYTYSPQNIKNKAGYKIREDGDYVFLYIDGYLVVTTKSNTINSSDPFEIKEKIYNKLYKKSTDNLLNVIQEILPNIHLEENYEIKRFKNNITVIVRYPELKVTSSAGTHYPIYNAYVKYEFTIGNALSNTLNLQLSLCVTDKPLSQFIRGFQFSHSKGLSCKVYIDGGRHRNYILYNTEYEIVEITTENYWQTLCTGSSTTQFSAVLDKIQSTTIDVNNLKWLFANTINYLQYESTSTQPYITYGSLVPMMIRKNVIVEDYTEELVKKYTNIVLDELKENPNLITKSFLNNNRIIEKSLLPFVSKIDEFTHVYDGHCVEPITPEFKKIIFNTKNPEVQDGLFEFKGETINYKLIPEHKEIPKVFNPDILTSITQRINFELKNFILNEKSKENDIAHH